MKSTSPRTPMGSTTLAVKKSAYFRFFKRPLDLVLAGVALILATPAIAILAALIALRMGRPVFFRQERAGFQGREFGVLKFRTMTEAQDETGELLPDEARITPLGHFLRAYSLDELPQLWNVIRGDMSLVGPRPLLSRYLPRYSQFQARRHEVRPGITGWAQIKGRNTIDWPSRFELDVWYVDHVTFMLDLWIILATFAKVWQTDETTPHNREAMPEFLGNMEKETRGGTRSG